MGLSLKYFSGNFLGIVVFLQVIMYISLFLNLPAVRETVGLIYLTFIPGIIFIKLLKLELGTIEYILYAVGFSVAFLMLSGLAINEFGSIVGFSFPLSTLPLSLFINTLILIGAAAAYVAAEKRRAPFDFPKSRLFAVVAAVSYNSVIKRFWDLPCQHNRQQLFPFAHDSFHRSSCSPPSRFIQNPQAFTHSPFA